MTAALKRVDTYTSSRAAEIIRDLSKARERPDALLREAVTCASEIAPAVIDLAEDSANGESLDEDEKWLFFWGVHVLSAARRTELFQPLMRLTRQCSIDDLDELLGFDLHGLARIVISVFDGDSSTLIEACADCNLDGFARTPLIGALARLTFDGAVAHEATLAFLDRFDRESPADPDDFAWQGRHDAIYLLGLEDMWERLLAACREGRFVQPEDELEYCQERLRIARNLAPGDAQLFEDAKYVPIDDVAESLRWISDSGHDEREEAPDPAGGIALNQDEIEWLAGFLKSEGMPADAMTVEEIDGFFCASAIEPDRAKAKEWMPAIFGSAERSPLQTHDQRTKVGELIVRMWNTIVDRFEAGYPHRPLLQSSEIPKAQMWANGFIKGMQALESEWIDRLKADDEIVLFAGPILTLSLSDDEERDGVHMTADYRAECLASVPSCLLGLYAAVRLEAERREAEREWCREPARSTKVGRNDPCPCGSGKKHKRCCGSPEMRALH